MLALLLALLRREKNGYISLNNINDIFFILCVVVVVNRGFFSNTKNLGFDRIRV